MKFRSILSERFEQTKGIAPISVAFCAPLLSAHSARAHQSEPLLYLCEITKNVKFKTCVLKFQKPDPLQSLIKHAKRILFKFHVRTAKAP